MTKLFIGVQVIATVTPLVFGVFFLPSIWLYPVALISCCFLGVIALKQARINFYQPIEEVQKNIVIVNNGWYLPPGFTQFIVRPLVSVIGALLVTIVVFIFLRLFLQNTALEENLHLTILGTIALAVALGWSDDLENNRNIPNAHVGILTFLNKRRNIYLTEGRHPWILALFFFGINTEPLYGTKNKSGSKNGPEQGYPFVGPDTLDIWNNGTKVDGKINRVLENVTRGGSEVFSSFTIFFQVTDPKKYSNVNDPILRIADQARASLRKTMAYFHDIDITSLKDTIASITKGDTAFIAFTTETIDTYPEGSVARDRGGNLLVEVINIQGEDESDADYEKRKEEAIKKLQKKVDDQTEIAERFHGYCHISEITIAEKIKPTVEACGAVFLGCVIANITLSDIVSNTAKEASALGQRRQITKELADMQINVIKEMKDLDVSDTLRVLAALQSGTQGVSMVHNSGGGNPLTQAAATIATQMGNSGASNKGGK